MGKNKGGYQYKTQYFNKRVKATRLRKNNINEINEAETKQAVSLLFDICSSAITFFSALVMFSSSGLYITIISGAIILFNMLSIIIRKYGGK